MTSRTEDYLGQYKLISNKLKKRFLRKPNVSEASEEFSSLALRCEGAQAPEFAGLCWLGAARCEGSLSNTSSETDALLRSARLFGKTDKECRSIGCPTAGQENLNAALHCYYHALSRYPENSPLYFGTLLESRSVLNKELVTEIMCPKDVNPTLTTYCLSDKASICIEMGDFTGALEALSLLSESIHHASGVYKDIAHRCEVSRLLLLLILEPPPGRLTPDLAGLIEKYSWTDFLLNAGSVVLPEELTLHLHALVAAWQSKDVEAICELRQHLVPYFTLEQKSLLRTLIQNYIV